MEEAKFKLFGVEISVAPPECSPSPPEDLRSTLSLLDQEKGVLHHQNKDFVSAADHQNNNDVVRTALGLSSAKRIPCSEVISRELAFKKRAFEETRDFNCSTNALPPLMKSCFPTKTFVRAQVGYSRGDGGISKETLLPKTTDFVSTTSIPGVRCLPTHHGRPSYDGDHVSRKSQPKKQAYKIHDPSSSNCHAILDNNIYNPMPLRSYSAEVGFSNGREKKKAKKSDHNKKKAKSIDRKKAAKSDEKKRKVKSMPAVLPLEEIPGLLRIIESHGGTRPVFLYKKELTKSDADSHLSRLFLSRRIDKELRQLMEFLSEEEKAAIGIDESRNGLPAIADDKRGKGLEFVGIDKKCESYNLRFKKWGSLGMIVINEDWKQIVSANNAEEGDWIELWGYRVNNNNNEFRLVLNFRKSETGNADGSNSQQ